MLRIPLMPYNLGVHTVRCSQLAEGECSYLSDYVETGDMDTVICLKGDEDDIWEEQECCSDAKSFGCPLQLSLQRMSWGSVSQKGLRKIYDVLVAVLSV